ncbi:uncharacterized protein LOC113545103 isoform X3 [Pangasianodon hypophthalmus]|uniref:uncharacterized protein LOC113545103 isoform X3 n=1 Tax=Pangasianodon hypophthalmus TaxID=310915 RepID=UPI002306E79B|nr:uncharacterized protein LOC113545103 isoform X3 [Pangasianodon hypophthalmus]
MGNPSHLDNNKEECEEPPSESDTTEQTIGQQDQEECTEGTTPSQTVNEECEEEVPVRADKATQTTEQNTSVEQMIWKYIPYQCLTSEHQRICENQLLQIQLTPATQQKLFKEDKRINEDRATSGQHVPDVELTSNNEEASESQLPNQLTDEVGNMECNEEAEQILEQQQTCMEVEPCVEEQACPVLAAQLPCENEEKNQALHNEDSPAVNERHVPDVELTSNNEEASESQLPNQLTDEVGNMECNEEAEQQILEQQQTSMEVAPSVEGQSCPVSAAQSMSEEEQPKCQDEPCQMQLAEQTQAGEETQPSNNDSSQTQNATQSSEADQESYLSSEDSNDETVSSDEEFLPDSDTDSDEDSDIEKPKKAKTSVTSKEIEEQAPVQNHLVTQATKLNFCFVCGKACIKIARHLKLHRKDNIEIETAFKLPKKSKQRSHILEVLRNRGNYQHNKLVLINGTGLIKARRMPKDDIDTHKFEYCMYCKGLYMRKELWKHVKRCTSNPERDMQKTSRSVLGLAALSQCPHLKHISDDVKKMLCDMHQDEVAQTIRDDEYVLKLAQDFFDKKGNSKERHAFVRQTVRCIGKFLVLLRNKFAMRNLAEAIKPSSFSLVTEAVKEIAEFNEEKKCFAIPSLARRIGLALRKYCILSARKAFAVGDKKLIQATGTFMDLFNNAQSQFALCEKRCLGIHSKSFLLPFVNDVRIFHCYLEKAAQCAMKELRETPSAQSYADLCKVTLAQILMFNRRHGEVSQMTIKSLQERDQAQASEISEALTELEKVFCEEYCKILVRQKIGALVPIILTPDMINALMLLTEKRDQCSVSKSNIYVFGQPRSNRCYRGENALRICANECGAMNPDRLTSTRFSRHISTLSQVLTLKNHELKKLAKFIGHDISLRKEYYRQTEATPRLAKICKLILAIEKGSATEMLGQSLDDIVLPDEIRESDSEDEYFEEDDAFLKDREARHELALHLLSKKKMTKPKTSNKNCSVPDLTPKKQHNESTSKEQENESTSKEQDKKSTTEEPKGKPAQEQTEKKKLKVFKKKVLWTREEKIAIMKHFKKHIYYGRLATVKESRRCQMLEQPVLNGRTIQKIRDFVRNAGISFKKKMAAKNGWKKVVLPPQPANPNNTSVQSPQSTNTSPSSELSSQTANSTSSSVIQSPATDFIKPIIYFSQTANATTTTTLLPQATTSASNVAHPQTTKLIYIKVQAHHSANQTTASLPLLSHAANPSIIPASVVLPQTANPSISSTDILTIPQVADLTNSSILIPQVSNHTGSSVLPHQAAPLICAGVLVPQAANPTTYNVLTLPAAEPASSTVVPPQIAVLKCASVPSPQGAEADKSIPPAQAANLSSTLTSQTATLSSHP